MTASTRDSLLEGVTDALGFVLGGLTGWGLGQMFGFDFMRTPGYGASAMVGLVFIMLGCGGGRWLAQRVRARLTRPNT
jgi:hypothetical protein